MDVPPQYQEYHDQEWGREVRGDHALFERICLESFQAGLSWWIVLRRREDLRRVFDDFDAHSLSMWSDKEIERALADPSIIRNRAKVKAVVANARVASTLADGALTEIIWSHAPAAGPIPRTIAEVPAQTPESVALAKSLKALGLVFLGPTTCYALMQACGLVNDHLASCAFRAQSGG